MVLFEHTSSDKVIFEGEKTTVELTTYEKVLNDTYIVTIPSLNIHINTKRQEEIDALVHDTLTSFFRFWKNKQGLSKFYDHMLALGFSIRSSKDHHVGKSDSKGKKIKEELVLA